MKNDILVTVQQHSLSQSQKKINLNSSSNYFETGILSAGIFY